MKAIIIALALLFAVNCKEVKKITKAEVDELFNGTFDVPSNFTFLYKNLQCPFPKYTFGLFDDQSLGDTILKLSLKDRDLDEAISFFQEIKFGDRSNFRRTDCKSNKEQTGVICNETFAFSLSKEQDDKYIYSFVKYENLSLEYNNYKTEKRRVCKSPRKCKYESVRIPLGGNLDDTFYKGIRSYVITQIYGDIMKHI